MKDEMGFLIVSEGGDGLGLALRLQAEGHKTSMWIRDHQAEVRGEGMVQKGEIPDFNPYFVSDCTGAGALFDSYRQDGRQTFSGSQLADKLEADRKFASSVFKKCGINQPYSKDFTSWKEAEEFVRTYQDDRWVFKPEGKFSGNLPSYVSKDADDLLGMFEHFKGIIGSAEPEFVLQEFIEGTCISSEAWFCKDEFSLPFNHTLERKQFMNDDIGPSGGCTGNIVWRCDDMSCALCANLMKLEEFLREAQWVGPIDINTVIAKSDGDIYALEFTPRFGYDAFPTYLYGLFEGNFGEFIHDSCRGECGDQPLKDGFASGIRISIPPWPSEDFHSKSGLEIRGLRESNLERFYPYEVSLQNDKYITSGGYGIIGVAVGYGDTVEESFEDAYRFVEKLGLADMQYRTDFVDAFKYDLKQIRKTMFADFAKS